MNAQSIWNGRATTATYPALETAHISADVVVIGGGITGVTTALLLALRGTRVVLLESGHVGSGTSGHSTGNLYTPVSEALPDLHAKWGHQTKLALASRTEAVNLIERLVHEYSLPCGFTRVPWTHYAPVADHPALQALKAEFETLQALGLEARWADSTPLPFEVGGAIVLDQQAQLNPFHYVQQLAAVAHTKGCTFYEETPVMAIDEDKMEVRTISGSVHAGTIVWATHIPKGFHLVHAEMAPYREYAVAAPLKDANALPPGIFWGSGGDRLSIRKADADGVAHVLVIGSKHKTGQNPYNEEALRSLENVCRDRFATGSIAYRWAAQQYRSVDGLPYIGRSPGLATRESPVYFATGFGGDGLTYGTVAGMVLSDLILQRANEYAELYSPRRFTPVKSARSFVKENVNVVGQYLKDYSHTGRPDDLATLAPGVGCVVEQNGEKLAVYRNDMGRLSAVSAVCPHLKCLVHWNKAERSWDCPCHGSRFAPDGKVIEGPAISDLKPRAVFAEIHEHSDIA